MPYTPQTWIDYPNTTTPITAAGLNNIETGIQEANPGFTAWTPTLTLTGMTPSVYNIRTGGYRETDGICEAYFTIHVTSWSGTHSSPYWWEVDLPVATSVSSPYERNFPVQGILDIYPIGSGFGVEDVGTNFANLEFFLYSSTSFIGRSIYGRWGPSPPSGSGEGLISGNIFYPV